MQSPLDFTPHLNRLRALCAPLPQVEEYVMVHHPAFRVGKKPFAFLGGSTEVTLSIKVPRIDQPFYLEDPRFSKTPYVGQHGWVSMRLEAMDEEEVRHLVQFSYRGVAPKRALAALDAADSR